MSPTPLSTLSVRRPSLLNRALSTPPQTPTSPDMVTSSVNTTANMWTPPVSPKHSRSSSDLAGLDDVLTSPLLQTPNKGRMPSLDLDTLMPEVEYCHEGILCCPFDVDLVQDARGRAQLFGSGAWSNVFKATPSRRALTAQGILTPPSSPTVSLPIIIAVKKAARNDAKPILRNEASILTYIHLLADHQRFTAAFYGVDGNESLILGAIPLSLEDHIRRSARSAAASLNINNMHLPVIGSSRTWLALAHKLVSALTWLHEHDVVHGDIKPGNFLLEPVSSSTTPLEHEDTFPYNPLFIDFSSSHIPCAGAIPPHGTLSAVTREYTAPELLKAAVLRDPASTATKASDVFSLAITMLVAATGNTFVYEGSVFQRQAMATQGWDVIAFIRGGANASRVSRHGLVQRAVERAVLKADMGRIAANKWLELVEDLMKGEPEKLR